MSNERRRVVIYRLSTIGNVNTRMQRHLSAVGRNRCSRAAGSISWGDGDGVILADSSGGLLPIFDGDHQPVPDDLGRHDLCDRSHQPVDSSGPVGGI